MTTGTTTREYTVTTATMHAAEAPRDLVVTQPDLRVVPGTSSRSAGYEVTAERVLVGADADEAWCTYRDSLAPLANVAAMKQVLPEAQLRAVVGNPAILKYVGRDVDGVVVAVLTLTSDLSTETINREFFTSRYPEHAVAGRLLYLGFLVVRPEAQARGLLMGLVGRLTADLEDEGGVVAFDVCGYNDETFAFARLCRLVSNRTRPTQLVSLDVQT